MPSVSLSESDTVLEINHHIVHLNTGQHQRYGNPGDFLGRNIITHNKHLNDSLHQHPGGGSTTPILPGHGGTGLQQTDEESLIVVYALFLPLLAALVFILIVALYIRRMRRSTSASSVRGCEPSTTQNNHNLTHYHNHGMEYSSTDLSKSASPVLATTTTFSYPPRPKSVEPEFRSESRKSNHSSSSSSSARTHSHQHGYSFENRNDLTDSPTNQSSSKGSKNLGGKFVSIPKRVYGVVSSPIQRIRAHRAEKHRFNIYTVPIETREQLKQIYVY